MSSAAVSATSSSTLSEIPTASSKRAQRRRVDAGAMAAEAADTARGGAALATRTMTTALFWGILMGVSVPASPVFYKTFQGSTAAQFRIINQFAGVGVVCSALTYALFLDNAKPGSSSISPQFKSVFSPMAISVACWLGGHLFYPGHFVLMCEERGNKLREFARLSVKCLAAFHRIHLPFLLGWGIAFGITCKPFREKPQEPAVARADASSAPEGK
jgi:hypothetical protein